MPSNEWRGYVHPTDWERRGEGQLHIDGENRDHWTRIPVTVTPTRLAEARARSLRQILDKCEQYRNAPRLLAEEQHAVLEFIERAALRALEDDEPEPRTAAGSLD